MIEFWVNHEHRLIVSTVHGELTSSEIRKFQYEVWSLPEASIYDCILDLTDCTEFSFRDSTAASMDIITSRAARLDRGTVVHKLFIVAPADWQYGLARMYSQYRMMKHQRRTFVVRSMTRALELLAAERENEGSA